VTHQAHTWSRTRTIGDDRFASGKSLARRWPVANHNHYAL
jgi:hypothetical protein